MNRRRAARGEQFAIRINENRELEVWHAPCSSIGIKGRRYRPTMEEMMMNPPIRTVLCTVATLLTSVVIMSASLSAAV